MVMQMRKVQPSMLTKLNCFLRGQDDKLYINLLNDVLSVPKPTDKVLQRCIDETLDELTVESMKNRKTTDIGIQCAHNWTIIKDQRRCGDEIFHVSHSCTICGAIKK